MGAIVKYVHPGSIAEELGIRPGDEFVAVNGHPLRDLIDYRFHTADESFELLVSGPEGETAIEIEWEPGDDLGVEFESPVFDEVRECTNKCVFCFVDQAAPGMRASTLLHDDDYRLSFLCGNFVTLTELADADVERILEWRLSPLYVSVHSTDPQVRMRLFRSRHHQRGLDCLKALTAGGVDCHCQVVLCPGINDGDHLARTVADLAALWPRVPSVGIVPVGLTRHRQGLFHLSPMDVRGAATILEQVHGWQTRFLERLGTRFVFAADELYLTAGVDFPPLECYEELPQIENGVGLCRPFVDELTSALWGVRPGDVLPTTLVTGESAGPVLQRTLSGVLGNQHACEVVSVANTFFGQSVTVAGLLAGRDIMEALRPRTDVQRVLLPSVALSDEGLFIDDLPLEHLRQAVGVPVEVVDTAQSLARSLVARQRGQTDTP